MKQRPNKRQKAVANALLKGLGPTQAIRAGGYPDAQARKGMAFIHENAGIKRELIRTAKSMTPEAMEALALGRLLQNIETGEDRATQSIKLLGQHKRHNWWESETRSGVVVIQVPASLANAPLDEPPLLPSRAEDA